MTSLRGRLLLFGYPLLEVATAYVIAQAIGWGWMLLLVVLGFPVGFAIMRNAGESALRDAQRAQRDGTAFDPSGSGLAFAGGLLIAIPGFWTDLVGLLLVIPLTRRVFRRLGWFSRAVNVRMPGVRYPGGDIIQGTVVRREEPGPNPPSLGAPGTGES